jgi:hypothetical protein
VHYRKKNGGAIDTAYSSLKLNNTLLGSTSGTNFIAPSSTTNNIIRSRAGFPVSNPTPSELYLQTTPGTYVNLSIPRLTTMPNRIIHRAEIIIQQIPNSPLDNIFTAPSFVYVDLKDTGLTDKWKPVYRDLNPSTGYDPDYKNAALPYFPAGGVDLFYYGGYRRDMVDKFGNPINFYNINITRYVQEIVTKHTSNYNLRLYAPSYLYYPQIPGATYIPYSNLIAKGRVKIGGGANPNYKMILRVIYSNL